MAHVVAAAVLCGARDQGRIDAVGLLQPFHLRDRAGEAQGVGRVAILREIGLQEAGRVALRIDRGEHHLEAAGVGAELRLRLRQGL